MIRKETGRRDQSAILRGIGNVPNRICLRSILASSSLHVVLRYPEAVKISAHSHFQGCDR